MGESVADLIDLALQRAQVTSGRELARVARQRGLKLDHNRINGLRSGTYPHKIQPETVRAIAVLAGVSEARAFAAAGVRQPAAPFAAELHRDADYLEPDERQVINDLIAIMTRGRAVTERASERSAPGLRVLADEAAQEAAYTPGAESQGARARRRQDDAETGSQVDPHEKD